MVVISQNLPEAAGRPRVLFFGMTGAFSLPPLVALLEQDIEVCAVIVPAALPVPGTQKPPIRQRTQTRADRFGLPRAGNHPYASIAHLAWTRQLPVWEVSKLAHPDTVATLAAYQVDCICVACFSRRIPRILLDVPRLGCLNVHPSLLPANRGPAPLFWTFHEGSDKTGVTIHLMDEGLDTGPILTQQTVIVPDGIRYTDLEQRCAVLGGTLLAESVWKLYKGNALVTLQDEQQSSYHPQPQGKDFILIPEQLHARHVYNFIHGVRQWGEAIRALIGKRAYIARYAISYSLWDVDKPELQALLLREGVVQDELGSVCIRCLDGWVKVNGEWDASQELEPV